MRGLGALGVVRVPVVDQDSADLLADRVVGHDVTSGCGGSRHFSFARRCRSIASCASVSERGSFTSCGVAAACFDEMKPEPTGAFSAAESCSSLALIFCVIASCAWRK